MFGWSDLRFLRAVSRTGSTVAEACALGVNRTKVARRINANDRRPPNTLKILFIISQSLAFV
jgi:hypothetical protein